MANQYLSDLKRSLQSRYSIESAGMTTGEWITKNTLVRGKQFSFDDYKFQRAICDDLHPDLDVIKISQVGLTEVQLRKALAFCVRNQGVTGIFSLPNEAMFRKLAQSRLKPMVEENRSFQPEVIGDPVKSINLMQIGRSFLHVVNGTEASATSTPADFVFNDEVDLTDQKVLALFASRLQNSDFRIKQRFSTPSWVGFGIDASYAVSDQREYVCKCSACNHYQIPLFTREFVYIPGLSSDIDLEEISDQIVHGLSLDDAFVMCNKCGAPLDLNSSNREWVATYPTRTHARGYRVRPFTSARIDISYIVNELLSYKRRDFVRGWKNTVIGEAYTDARARLDEGQIKACMGSAKVPEISSGDPIMVGIDIGQMCHAVKGRSRGDDIHVFEFSTFQINKLPEFLRETEAQYHLIGGALDRHPYTPTAEEARDITDCRVMPIEYRGTAELVPVKSVEGMTTHWQADRTKLLDRLARRVRERTIHFEGYGIQQTIIISHLRDQIREEDSEKPGKWVKLTGIDHYSHALAFLLAAFRLQEIEGKINRDEVRSTIMFGGLKIQMTANRL